MRRGSSGGDVRVSPFLLRSHSIRFPSSTLVVASYEWVRNDILKYKSYLTSATSIAALQH